MANGQIVYIRRVSNDDEAPNRIRELREAIGLSQAELARMVHVTPSALNKLEKGTRGLDQNWMRRIAPHLGVSPAELLPLSDNPHILDKGEFELLTRYRSANYETQKQLQRVSEAILPFKTRPADAA